MPEITCTDKQELIYYETKTSAARRSANSFQCAVKSATSCRAVTRTDCKQITWNECNEVS